MQCDRSASRGNSTENRDKPLLGGEGGRLIDALRHSNRGGATALSLLVATPLMTAHPPPSRYMTPAGKKENQRKGNCRDDRHGVAYQSNVVDLLCEVARRRGEFPRDPIERRINFFEQEIWGAVI